MYEKKSPAFYWFKHPEAEVVSSNIKKMRIIHSRILLLLFRCLPFSSVLAPVAIF